MQTRCVRKAAVSGGVKERVERQGKRQGARKEGCDKRKKRLERTLLKTKSVGDAAHQSAKSKKALLTLGHGKGTAGPLKAFEDGETRGSHGIKRNFAGEFLLKFCTQPTKM